MSDDPSFDPPRGLVLARVLAVIGCAAAGAFAFLWMDADERATTEVARVESARDQVIATEVAKARKSERDKAAREIAAERARHARDLEAARGEQGTALAKRVSSLQEERDDLMQALAGSRARSQRLREDMKRMQREMERALESSEEKMRLEARRWAAELSKTAKELGDAEAQAREQSDKVDHLQRRINDPREGALARRVLAHVGRVYAGIDVDLEPNAAPLVQALGRGSWLQPFLADRYGAGPHGVWAMAHTAALEDIDHVALVEAIAAVARRDSSFTRMAATALLAGNPTGVDDRIAAALNHRETSVRLVAVEAAAMASKTTLHPSLLAAVGNDATDVVDRALTSLARTTQACRTEFIAALATSSLGEDARRRAWKKLLFEGRPLDLPALVDVAAREPSVLDAEPDSPDIGESQVVRVFAEALAQVGRDDVVALRRRLAARLVGEGLRDDLPAICSEPSIRGEILWAARRRVFGDPARSEAAALLPSDGVILPEPASVVRLAAIARPVHFPYLVANVSAAAPVDRVRVASALHRFGHPKGREILDDLVNARQIDVRSAALAAYADLRLPNVDALVHRRLHEASPMREAAISAAESLELAIPHDFIPVALDCGPPWSEMLLDAIGRSPDRDGLIKTLLHELGAGNVIDGDTVARWVFADGRRPDPTTVRASWRHRHPAVRARAIEASRGLDADDEPASRIATLDPFVKDPDFRVRVQVARSFAEIRHDLARTTLVRLAKDESPWVRDEAIQALGRQERYHVIPVLRAAAHDKSPYVRNAAFIAMIAHGVKTESHRVLDALDDPRLGFRTKRALDRILGRSEPDRAGYERAINDL